MSGFFPRILSLVEERAHLRLSFKSCGIRPLAHPW
jgi:hypothetical protein